MINANVQKGDISPENNISAITEELLADVRSVPSENNSLSVPITQLATLGSGVASLLPALRTVTKTTTTASPGGLYRLLNDAGNGLKQAKDGSFWGATVESKMGKFEEVKGIDLSKDGIYIENFEYKLFAVVIGGELVLQIEQ